MSVVKRFPLLTPLAAETGWRGYARAVARRFTLKAAAVSLAAILLLNEFRDIGNPMAATDPAPPGYWLSATVILGCQWLLWLLAVLLADEAVERGAARARTYVVAVVVSSLAAATLQYLVRLAFDLRVYTSSEEFLVLITHPVVFL